MDTATRDYLLEHHHEIYKSQSERTDKVYGRFSLLVTPFTILGGGLLYVFRNYPHDWIGPKSLLFYIPFFVSAGAFLMALSVAFYCLARGFDYMSIRRPRLLQQDVNRIVAYAVTAGPQFSVLDKVKTALMERYCEAADYNFEINYGRTKMLLRSTQLAIISGVFLLVCVPFALPNQLHRPSPSATIVLNHNFFAYGRPRQHSDRRRWESCDRHSLPRASTRERASRGADNRSEYVVDRGDQCQ